MVFREDGVNQRAIEEVFELLGLSSAPGPLHPIPAPAPTYPLGCQRVVFIAAESTSEASEPEVHAELERDPQRDKGVG
jgi:hypothetical protein